MLKTPAAVIPGIHVSTAEQITRNLSRHNSWDRWYLPRFTPRYWIESSI